MEANVQEPRKRSNQVVNRVIRMFERGKIKIGGLGEERKAQGGGTYRLPVKLDHFRVVLSEKGPDGEFPLDTQVHEILGEKPTTIPVRLLFNDIDMNFRSRYAAYQGTALFCAGDGETALRAAPDGSQGEVECPCDRLERGYKGKDKCKINGKLQVLIDGAPNVGGVYVLRTTSFNTVDNLLSSLNFLQFATGGQIAEIPLNLVVSPKQGTDPDGKPQTIYVVSLEYRGGSLAELQDSARQIAMSRVGRSVEYVEREARKLLDAPSKAVFDGEDAEDIQAEFYPHAGDPSGEQEQEDEGGGDQGGRAVSGEPQGEREPPPPSSPPARPEPEPPAAAAAVKLKKWSPKGFQTYEHDLRNEAQKGRAALDAFYDGLQAKLSECDDGTREKAGSIYETVCGELQAQPEGAA